MSLQPRTTNEPVTHTLKRIPYPVALLALFFALLIVALVAIPFFVHRGSEATTNSYEATYGVTDAKLSADGSKVNFTKNGTYHECLTPKDEDFGKPLTCFTATTVNPASSK